MRLMRVALVVIVIGSVFAGLIYAIAIFHAIAERNRAPHVQHHSTH